MSNHRSETITSAILSANMPVSYETLNKSPRPTEGPPFTLKELKACVPAHCFKRSTFKSFYYAVLDVTVCWSLCFLSCYIEHPTMPSTASLVLWPVYWVCQGCVCTGIWVLAHECGHRAFSESKAVCDVVGLVFHSALLVPYYSWQISHAKHHRSTNDIDHDEVFIPKTRAELSKKAAKLSSFLGNVSSLVQKLLLGWPAYLFLHVAGRKYHTHTDHFNPRSPLFTEKDFFHVFISDVALLVWILLLGRVAFVTGFSWLIKIYVIPYLIVNFWLVLITDLQHSDASIPHYRGKSWNWLKGALCTVDRDYGLLNQVFHHIGDTHVAHHLFPQMPHYHAVEATENLKQILGKFYNKDTTPIFKAIWQNERYCRYVDDRGEELWFKHD